MPLDFLDRIHQKSAGKFHLLVFELSQSKIQGILRHKSFGFFASFLKNEQIIIEIRALVDAGNDLDDIEDYCQFMKEMMLKTTSSLN